MILSAPLRCSEHVCTDRTEPTHARVALLSEPRPHSRVSLATYSSASVAYILASAAISASPLSCAVVNICIIIYLRRYRDKVF